MSLISKYAQCGMYKVEVESIAAVVNIEDFIMKPAKGWNWTCGTNDQ